ncbi:MAG: Gfo/Idh/MocA family oxidoreductase [Phycisphaerae bacterium]|nr:Gfo/Idh/MocA family oxidoreductase [Phycisphaerae bacterium]
MAKVRLALVGCGNISRNHIRGMRDLHERGCDWFEVTACVDPVAANAERAAGEIGQFQKNAPAVCASVKELVSRGLAEAADLCLPHCFHHNVAIECLEGGLHVMVEKPLGLTIRASRAIIAAAKRAGKVLATGENIRRYRTSRACAWALTQKKLVGEVRAVDIVHLNHSPLNPAEPLWKWRAIKALTGGGMIMDSGAHTSDMLVHMFGEPETVYCRMSTLSAITVDDAPVLGRATLDVEDEWHVVINFKNGVRFTWTSSRVCPCEDRRHGRYYGSRGIMTDKGFVMHPFQGGGEAVTEDGTVTSEQIEEQYLASLSQSEREHLFPFGSTDGFAIEVADFVRAVATGGSPEMDGEAGLRSKAMSIACYESATRGEIVRYDDVLAGRITDYQDPLDKFWKIPGA